MKQKKTNSKTIETLTHADARRRNIPTAEFQSVLQKEAQDTLSVTLPRNAAGLEEEKASRNRDLDPQLVWHGKDEKDWSDLVVNAPPIYIQEKVHPKVLIDDLLRQTASSNSQAAGYQNDLFADFNGIPTEAAKTEFYQHDANWTNRMILGDSLQVMASLAEREGLRGKVQCIYFDPPYGIKFNSNFQWSTTSRDVKDGNIDHITREPEQVKAFRDTWRDGIHSYLTYLRDRLTVARDLLTESGSIFVQIGDENVHRVRALMDEVFGPDNFVSVITVKKTAVQTDLAISSVADYIIWFCKFHDHIKYRTPFVSKLVGDAGSEQYRWVRHDDGSFSRIQDQYEQSANALCRPDNLTSSHEYIRGREKIEFRGESYGPGGRYWSTSPVSIGRLGKADRLHAGGKTLSYARFLSDFFVMPLLNVWTDTGTGGYGDERLYVVQTTTKVIQRCILMATDPGDLVLDPTCGSGTTAYVSEQWGRRWITIDTSRVALALARARIMGARYPYYLLADSRDGQIKEAEISRKEPSTAPTRGDIRQGFVYERVPHITLKSIANNTEIDVIWEKWQEKLEPIRKQLNESLGRVAPSPKPSPARGEGEKRAWEEWEIPRDLSAVLPAKAGNQKLTKEAEALHKQWWQYRIERQKEIDASIAAKADVEYLYDKSYDDKKKVRVAGPFTVESLLPHRVLTVDENDELIDGVADSASSDYGTVRDFTQIILENLKIAGVQQAHKDDKINFTSLTPWPGHYICAEGRYEEKGEVGRVKSEIINGQSSDFHTSPLTLHTSVKRAAIFVGPEFGTVSRPDLVAAAREAGDADFDVLITCAFNYDAHSSEFNKLGRIPVLKARMNADLHMADDLKNTGKGNLFIIFGEPDIEVASEEWLVDSSGRRVAPYEIFKLVSGVSSLAEINRLSREDLCDYAKLSCRGEVWDYLANASGGNLDSGKHRRGPGAPEYGGVSSIAWHCAGVAGGAGNISDFIGKLALSGNAGFREFIERVHRDQQNVKCSDQITIHSPLITRNYFQVTIIGVDVFHPNTGEVRSDGAEGIACWFIDTDYNEESFFVRHAYFLGANDPYKALKTTLKAEINEEAWATLNSDISRPFDKPKSGRIAVKVINHLGDEVMKVFRV